MSTVLAFSASCKRGHDLETFTDRKAFEAHMTKGHKARKPAPAKGPGPRKGGLPAKYLTPNRAPQGTEGLTKVLLEVDHWCDAASPGRGIFAGVDDDWTTAERVSPDQLEPGDVFRAGRSDYVVRSKDQERGWELSKLDDDRTGWVRELTLGGRPVETVVIVKRAA